METKKVEDRTFFKGINIQVTPEDWDEIYKRLDVLRKEIADQSKREERERVRMLVGSHEQYDEDGFAYLDAEKFEKLLT